MKEWDVDELEKFIRSNKDKFNVYQPKPGHNEQFLRKLLNKFREVISIVPYLVKVGVTTALIFIISFLVWKMYICPPLTHVSLKYWRVEHSYRYQIHRDTRLIYSYIKNQQDSLQTESVLHNFDATYKILRKQLRENPSADNSVKMLEFYKEELLSLEDEIQNYRNKEYLKPADQSTLNK